MGLQTNRKKFSYYRFDVLSNRIFLIYWQYSGNIKYTRITSLEKKKIFALSLFIFFFLAQHRENLHPQQYNNRVLPNCEKNLKQLKNTSFIFQDPQCSTLRVVIWSLDFIIIAGKVMQKILPNDRPLHQ